MSDPMTSPSPTLQMRDTKKKKLTNAERAEARAALTYLGLKTIADDILDWVDERRKSARGAARAAKGAKS